MNAFPWFGGSVSVPVHAVVDIIQKVEAILKVEVNKQSNLLGKCLAIIQAIRYANLLPSLR